MFESDVEIDNKEHIDVDFKFKIFVAKKLMHLESKKKISKCVTNEIVDFAASIASAGLRKHNVVKIRWHLLPKLLAPNIKGLSSMKKTVHLSNQKKLY